MVLKNVFLIGFLFSIIAISGCLEQSEERTSREVFGDYNSVTPTPEIKYVYVAPTPEIRYVYAVPESTPIPSSTLSSDIRYSLQEARNDYSWRLDLINEQQGRIDILFAVKAGVSMQQQEYKGWIDSLKSAVDEHYARANNAVNSSQSYRNLLNANINSLDTNYYNSEIKWINKNYDIMTSDYDINKANLNNAVNRYNNCFVYKTGCS